MSYILQGEYSRKALQFLDVAGLHPGAHQEALVASLEWEVSHWLHLLCLTPPHCPPASTAPINLCCAVALLLLGYYHDWLAKSSLYRGTFSLTVFLVGVRQFSQVDTIFSSMLIFVQSCSVLKWQQLLLSLCFFLFILLSRLDKLKLYVAQKTKPHSLTTI